MNLVSIESRSMVLDTGDRGALRAASHSHRAADVQRLVGVEELTSVAV